MLFKVAHALCCTKISILLNHARCVPLCMHSNCWPEFFGVESFGCGFLCFKFASETSLCVRVRVILFFQFVLHALVKLHTFQFGFSSYMHVNHTVCKCITCIYMEGYEGVMRITNTTLQSKKHTLVHIYGVIFGLKIAST